MTDSYERIRAALVAAREREACAQACDAELRYTPDTLGARIYDLSQQGHEIETEHRHIPNGKVVADYQLKEKASC